MEGMKMIPMIALLITISGVIIGAGVISLGKFQGTVTTCLNSSFSDNSTANVCRCQNNTLFYSVPRDNNNMTAEAFAICQSQLSEVDIAEQLPTVAIIGIMVIIISIIASVFVYMKFFT